MPQNAQWNAVSSPLKSSGSYNMVY
ncbi:uncharacterized protein METZ01_LOCUS203267, partial [marine metagenome]